VTLVLPVTVSLTPTAVSLVASQTQQFSAVVGNSSNTAVTWSLTPSTGTISTSGLYTAPSGISSQQTVTVTATSVADTTKSASSAITLNPLPSITSVSATAGGPAGQYTISGSGFGATQGTGTVWLGTTFASVVSWSSTQIQATVASNSQSGTAQVRQASAWSNTVPFTVATPTISTVTPTSGVQPGITVVTVAGSGFGAAQGNGQVWLGTAYGAVQSWSDSAITATVAAGSVSGTAQVLQNNVVSNAVPFTVDALQIATISPTSGTAGALITFAGSGFGSSPGTAWLGSTAGQIQNWSDTQVTAWVATGALSGIARIQPSGGTAWSNALGFTVPAAGGNIVTPAMLNMLVGDTHTIQAVSASGQPVTGLTWSTSDPTVVSLSTDNPPILTAVAPGHVTITAGTGSADVTVWDPTLLPNGTLPLGTVIWSNPGDGSGVTSIVPAVPSTGGVADVFAFNSDGTVSAITSDGTTAWTASATAVSTAIPILGFTVPDFLGGLAVVSCNVQTGDVSIVRLDGSTGQPDINYTSSGCQWGGTTAVDTDGTIIDAESLAATVVGIDPTTGAPRFSVPMVQGNVNAAEDPYTAPYWPNTNVYDSIVAGDGNAYIAYGYEDAVGDVFVTHLMLLRTDTSGNYSNIDVMDWTTEVPSAILGQVSVNMITNADQGIFLAWEADPNGHEGGSTVHTDRFGRVRRSPRMAPRVLRTTPRDSFVDTPTFGMAMVSGTAVTLINAPTIPNQAGSVVPVLQLQDGSFVGSVGIGPYPEVVLGTDAGITQTNMVAFDASGNVRWMVPNMCPQIATDDGGLIALSAHGGCSATTGPAITFDQKGNATGQVTLLTQSWPNNAYQVGSVDQVVAQVIYLALSWWAVQGGNQGGTGTATNQQWFPELKSCQDPGGNCTKGPLPRDLLLNARSDLVSQLVPLSSCEQAAKTWVFDVVQFGLFGTGRIDSSTYTSYLQNIQHFYDGTKSTLPSADLGVNCGFTTVAQCFFGAGSGTFAVTNPTGNPKKPMISFWQPAAPTSSNNNVGLDPTNNGRNLSVESNLFHEAIHGYTGLVDGAIWQNLSAMDNSIVANTSSYKITLYVQKHVLSACPISTR
jgi:hypothetical protein